MTGKRLLLLVAVLALAVGGSLGGVALAAGLSTGTATTRGPAKPSPTATRVVAGPAGKPIGRVLPRGNGTPPPQALWVDGCDHDYVSVTGANVCVPRAAPPGKSVTCAYLKAHGFGALEVAGRDAKVLGPGGKAAARGAVVCPPK